MNKMDWLILLTVTIPVMPALLKELRLWWEALRGSGRKKNAEERECGSE